LRETGLRGANLSEAEVGWGIFGNVDLSETQGLHSVRHLGPSTIGIDTLYRSQGKIPRIFLQGAGVPDNLITSVDSLAVRSPSCFVIYSTRDRQFAERLYADLQTAGVRCWLAPEEVDIEDKIRLRIDASIRVHGNVLLILSRHSVDCVWVKDEAQTAFEVESKRKETVLFPVRLDQSVMDTDQAWAASIRATRHVCDFSGWEDPRAYQEALSQLLDDLKRGK
ncbi:MAG: toll/interleukin-1 receptor domain-containing protein, partial [Thermodesulfobacteriota bacterium]|nr:toll/interleukin-1 receptor domain-containing protein [Thermodesulfobacteriota bacterium]